MENKKIKAEEIEEKVQEIISSGKINKEKFEYLATLAGHDNAVILKVILKELWFLEKKLGDKRVINLSDRSNVKFINGGWVLVD